MSSEHMTATLVEVETQWTVSDVLDAHDTLDLLDDLRHKAATASRRR